MTAEQPSPGPANSPQERTVLFDHDGGVDDLLSLMMALAMPHLKLAGVVVTPADCFLGPAVSATRKILRFFGRSDIEVSQGNLYGVNHFPRAWRAHPYAVDAFPILNELKPTLDQAPRSGQAPGSIRPKSPQEILSLAGQPPTWTRGAIEALKERIRNELRAALDPDLELLPAGEARRILQEQYDRILAQENIILSRTERSRLFEGLAAEFFNAGEKELPKLVAESGHEFLARKLHEATEPVTILITGPVSNLAATLTAEPELASKIEEVVWMGGALQVQGNVRDYEHDGSAEWNAYWDPPGTHRLWQSKAPLTLFPLDATNQVQVTRAFLHRLAQQRQYPLSDLAGQCWALTVGTIPAYEYKYHMWDTLTTGYLGAPQFITFRETRTLAIPTGPGAGQIKEVSQGGKLTRVADKVDVKGFLNYILELFRR